MPRKRADGSEPQAPFSPSLNLRRLRAIFAAAGVEFTNSGKSGVRLNAKPPTIAAENASNDE
jgi:hypothetical protein